VETQRIPQFENEHVKVWRSVISPNVPLPLHRHEHGRVIIALQGGTMKIEEQTGASETQVWETGKGLLVASESSQHDAQGYQRRRPADRGYGGRGQR
jgi:hypothetical protein